jgi:acetylornithine deacetylase
MKMEFPWRFLLLQLFSSVFIAQLSQCDQFPIHLTPDQPLSDPEESQLLYLHKRLIEIESITGNEKSVGDWLADYLTDHGLKVEKQKVAPHRFNILAYPGDNPHTKVLLTSHIDTV